MIRTICRAAVALAVPLAMLAAPHQAIAEVCATTNTFTYSPPLGIQSTSGQMSGTASNLCTNTALAVYTRNVPIGTTYTGNCVLAVFGANTFSVVVLGGTVHVMVDVVERKSKVMPMVPNGACPTSSATGTGLWVDE